MLTTVFVVKRNNTSLEITLTKMFELILLRYFNIRYFDFNKSYKNNFPWEHKLVSS